MSNGLVGYNEQGKIKMMTTGEELPTMYGRGGMKEALKLRMAMTAMIASSATVNSADVGAIIFDDRVFGSLRNRDGSIRVTTLDFENGIHTDQIIDVEANEKRKRDALDHTQWFDLELTNLDLTKQKIRIQGHRMHVQHQRIMVIYLPYKLQMFRKMK